jgi:hypothetical protein
MEVKIIMVILLVVMALIAIKGSFDEYKDL